MSKKALHKTWMATAWVLASCVSHEDASPVFMLPPEVAQCVGDIRAELREPNEVLACLYLGGKEGPALPCALQLGVDKLGESVTSWTAVCDGAEPKLAEVEPGASIPVKLHLVNAATCPVEAADPCEGSSVEPISPTKCFANIEFSLQSGEDDGTLVPSSAKETLRLAYSGYFAEETVRSGAAEGLCKMIETQEVQGPKDKVEVRIELEGIGTGSVFSQPVPLIGCNKPGRETCTATAAITIGRQLTLVAETSGESSFKEWAGCVGDSNTDPLKCTVKINEATTLRPSFGYLLSASAREVDPGFRGTLDVRTSSSAAVQYIDACSVDRACGDHVFIAGETIIFNAMPMGEARVEGWVGCDARPGEETCSVTMDAPHAVIVDFGSEFCGNGSVGGQELCDDGGAVGGDGCSEFCEVEPGYRCIGTLSVCRGFVVSKTSGLMSVEGGASDMFTVHMTHAPEATIRIPVSFDPLEVTVATAELEFTVDNFDQPQEVLVAAFDDLIDEPDKPFTVELGLPVGDPFYTSDEFVPLAPVTGTTVDNEDPPEISIAGVSLDEGNAGSVNFDFVVTLSRESDFPVSVDFRTVDGTATTNGNDYVEATGTLTFPARTTSATVRVTVQSDVLSEEDETFSVTLSNPMFATIAMGQESAIGTIEDEDPNPFFIISDVNVDEGDAATFTVLLNTPSGREVRVNWATANNTAVAADYMAGSGTLIFPVGTTQQMVSINTTEDTTDEPSEAFFVNLTGPVNADVVDGQGSGEILDDDLPPCLAITALASINETNSPFNVTVSVTLSAVSGHVVTVDYATSNMTATAGADYTAASGMLTFNPGSTSATFNVSISGDTLDENNETFTIGLSNEQQATICASGSATATIVDEDPRPTLSINSVAGDEGDATNTTLSFTVTLSAASGLPVTVDWATAPGSALSASDFVSDSGTLMFAPGTTTRPIDITVVADTVDEPLETFTVVLSSPNANATIAMGGGTGTGTVRNDDGPPTLSIADVSVNEANTTMIFTVLVSDPSGQVITVSWAATPGSATAPADFTAASGSLMFIANDTSETFSVTIFEDLLDEDNETITLTLSSPNNATLGDGVATGTIVDDDDLPTLSIAGVTIAEGDAGTTNMVFTVTLTPVSGRTVTVTYETINGSAIAPDDFAALGPAVLTFNAGQTSRAITVAIVGEASYEFDEIFTMSLSAPSNANLSATPSAIGTITNNDGPPSLSIASVSVTEGNAGTVDAVFNVTLFPASGRSASVSYATAPGTAVAADFVAETGMVTFNAGQTTQPITVQVNGDTLDEDVESFTVTLSTPVSSTIVAGTGTGTINDNDPTPSITITDVTVTEGNAGTTTAIFNINLSAASGRIVEVDYVTANGTTNPATAGSDYTALPLTTATFSPGTTTFPVSVTVTGDTRDELNETFFVNLSNESNGTLTDNRGVGTITDDDDPPLVTINNAAEDEPPPTSNTAAFTVTLSAASNLAITVTYATMNGTATAGSDFTTTSGTLNFPAGTITLPINVPILADVLDEDDETFTLGLTGATNATLGAPSSGTGTIIDNDAPPSISFMDDTITIEEPSSGTQTGVLTVTLSAMSGRAVSVNWATANNSAIAGDYVSASGTVMFPAGNISQTITLTVNSDAVANESNETFFVNLSGATNASILDNQAVITIDAPGPLARGEPLDRVESLLRVDEGGNAESRAAAISRDGEIVAFESDATNLVEDDINEATDIFVYDFTTQTLERISTHDNGPSTSPALSADGRYVVFHSSTDVFIYDRLIGSTVQKIEGATHANISADGRYLIYRKAAELFVHDRSSQATIAVKDATAAIDATLGISENGRFLLFENEAHLVLDDRESSERVSLEEEPTATAMTPDARSIAVVAWDRTIVVYDRVSGTTERIAEYGEGVSISDDGRYVAFGDDGVVVYDRKALTRTERLEQAHSPYLSGDGRFLVFIRNGAVYRMSKR